MPAYLREITKHFCDECKKRATHELRNRRNETCGHACKRCGEAWVKRVNAEEKAMAR